jgi:hypothetical protein
LSQTFAADHEYVGLTHAPECVAEVVSTRQLASAGQHRLCVRSGWLALVHEMCKFEASPSGGALFLLSHKAVDCRKEISRALNVPTVHDR